MNFAELIRRALAAATDLRTQRAAHVDEQTTMLRGLAADASLSAEQQARFDTLSDLKRSIDAQLVAADARVEQLRTEEAADEQATRDAQQRNPGAPAPTPGLETRNRDEATYTRRKMQAEGVSFFRDLWNAQMESDPDARERLQTHKREIADRLSTRATATGAFSSLIPPIYLADEYAQLARASRPFANIVRHEALPEQGMSLVIPRGTTGTTAAVQTAQNVAINNSDPAVSDLTVPVVTIAGSTDVSRQSLERGQGVDDLIFADIAAEYARVLDMLLFNGSGASGQPLGVLNTAGVGTVSAYGAPVTPTTFYSKLAGAINAVQTSRFLSPTAIVLHPRRWNWLVGQVDSAGRPLAVPGAQGPLNSLAGWDLPTDPNLPTPVGTIQGVPVITDPNIPAAAGTGPEDQVLVSRVQDLILWEDGDGAPKQLKFEQTLGGSLTVKLVAYGYIAFTAGRYPAASAVIGGNAGAGNGQVAPTF